MYRKQIAQTLQDSYIKTSVDLTDLKVLLNIIEIKNGFVFIVKNREHICLKITLSREISYPILKDLVFQVEEMGEIPPFEYFINSRRFQDKPEVKKYIEIKNTIRYLAEDAKLKRS